MIIGSFWDNGILKTIEDNWMNKSRPIIIFLTLRVYIHFKFINFNKNR
jgi:hypothetical protein